MYTPTKHTESNKSYAPSQGNPTDARSYFYDDTDGVKRQRIYQSKAEVLEEIIGVDREGHVFFIVNSGGTIADGFLSGGTNEIYYFKDGYTDDDLVQLSFDQINADWNATSGAAQILNKPTIAAQANADWNATTGVARILNKPTIVAPVNADWDATTGLAEILNKPTIVTYTSNNGITKTGSNFQLGGAIGDTSITGGGKMAFLNGRVGIGMIPIFPLDIQNTFANLGAQITSVLSLQNGQARLGMLSAMLLTGGAFTHTNGDQVSGATGQLTWYQAGNVVLNKSSSYAGKSGLIIGYATASITNSIISGFSAIFSFGNTGHYERVAGLRVTAPALSGFSDANNFTGTITNFYGVIIEAFDPTFYDTGTISNRWGFYQEGSEPNKFFGKLMFDATLGAGTGSVTVNKPSGTFTIGAGQTTGTVTNSMVTTSSLVMVQLKTNDATAKSCVAIEANGSFTVTLNAAATGAVTVKFIVFN